MKVVRHGTIVQGRQPPAGIRASCDYCFAVLVTEKREPAAKPTERSGARNIKTTGWYVPCPECGLLVFVADPNQ